MVVIVGTAAAGMRAGLAGPDTSKSTRARIILLLQLQELEPMRLIRIGSCVSRFDRLRQSPDLVHTGLDPFECKPYQRRRFDYHMVALINDWHGTTLHQNRGMDHPSFCLVLH